MGGLLPKPETSKRTEDGACAAGCWAFGVSDMQGWRKGMEDAHLAMPDFDREQSLGLFGVFDGHGGPAVAEVAAKRLPQTLREAPSFKKGNYRDALYEAFLLLDAFLDSPEGRKEVAACTPEESASEGDDEDSALQELIESGELTEEQLRRLQEEGEEEEEDAAMEESEEESGEDGEGEEEEQEEREEEDANDVWRSGEGPDGMGTTAVVALVRGGDSPEVIVANAGDSRCVLASGDRAVNLSRDHKPTLRSERNRIAKAGGFVTSEGRVDGNLNLSRALGDFAYKKDRRLKPIEQKISGEAEVKSRPLEPSDRYLLIGCDGIFEKVTSQQLVDFFSPRLAQRQGRGAPDRRRRRLPPLSSLCSAFLDHNIAKVPAREQGLGCDNMTLMLVDLQADACPPSTSRVEALLASPFRGRAAVSPAKVNGSPIAKVPRVHRVIDKDGVRRTGCAPGRRRLVLLAHQRRVAARSAAAAQKGKR